MTPGDLPVGTPWWVALILVLAFGRPTLGSAVMARIPGLLGAYARRRQAIRDRPSLPTASEMIDDKEIDRLRRRYEQSTADAAQSIAELRREISELRSEVQQLKESLTEANSQTWAAIAHIRHLEDRIRRSQPDARIPDWPPKLRGIVP